MPAIIAVAAAANSKQNPICSRLSLFLESEKLNFLRARRSPEVALARFVSALRPDGSNTRPSQYNRDAPPLAKIFVLASAGRRLRSLPRVGGPATQILSGERFDPPDCDSNSVHLGQLGRDLDLSLQF